MRSPFLSTCRVTQAFGANAAKYKPYGLAGHEGIDLVPIKPAWGVHAVEDGTVIADVDDPMGRDYGVHVRIRSPSGRAWIYAHLSENTVSLGDKVATGQLLGVMGDTGHSVGAHLHLSVYLVDEAGNKINEGNGYKGCLDPFTV